MWCNRDESNFVASDADLCMAASESPVPDFVAMLSYAIHTFHFQAHNGCGDDHEGTVVRISAAPSESRFTLANAC